MVGKLRKFKLGQVVVTKTINDIIADNERFAKDVTVALQRYRNCDWGEMDEEDLKSNNIAVETGEDRVFAAYQTSKGKIWVITEWERSYTTVLFPDEY